MIEILRTGVPVCLITAGVMNMKIRLPSDAELLRTVIKPTPAQAAAGNYRKGHVIFMGLDIAIENPRGSIRSGVSSCGKKWSNKMHHHYGYIKRTTASDGDQVDVFIGPDTSSFMVYVIDQVNPATKKFDEVKCMLGFHTKDAARTGYLANYTRGWQGLGTITAVPITTFKAWLKDGDTRKPFAEYNKNRGGNKIKAVIKAASARGTCLDYALKLQGMRKKSNDDYGDLSHKLHRAIAHAETGSMSNPWIRTKVRNAPGGSTAYGEVQMTRGMANDYRTRKANLFNPGELAYLKRYNDQGALFNRHGNERGKPWYNPQYDYGGTGHMTNDVDKTYYRTTTRKILEDKLRDTGGNINRAIQGWRGVPPAADRGYYKKVHDAIQRVDNPLKKSGAYVNMLPLTISNKITIPVEIADTPAARTTGMAKYSSAPRNAMLFDTPGPFWMKGMNYPIDIAFLSKEGEVLDIQHMPVSRAPAHLRATYRSRVPYARYALETPTGWFKSAGVIVGDTVDVVGMGKEA